MSYNLNNWNDDPKSRSTDTLGISKKEVRGSDDGSDTGFQKTRSYLVVLLLIIVLLLVCCIVLSIFLAKEVNKSQHSSEAETPAPSVTPTGASQEAYCYSPECLQLAAGFMKNMNESFDPCEDFFQHSCGSWIKDNPIPPSRNMLDTFIEMEEKNFQRLREMLEDVDQFPDKSAVKKTKRYFKSCLNEEQVENTAKKSIKQLMAKYGSWALDNQTWNSTKWDWSKILSVMVRNLESTPFFFALIDVNPQNSSQYLFTIYPPSLSLIRDEYLKEDNKTRLAYLKYMTTVGQLLGGGNDTRQQMEDVSALERKLAKIIPPQSELNANLTRTMNLTELESMAPGIAGFTWTGFLNELLQPFNLWVNASDQVIVPSPEYLRNMSYVINSTDKSTLSNYMMWTLVRSVVRYMSRDFRQALLKYEKETQGTKTSKPRWLSCLEDLNSYTHGLTFALGYMWVTNVFDVEIIPFIQEMMTSIRVAFKEETAGYEWIDEQTRQKIIEKEVAMKNKIGFPKLCANETMLNKYYENLNISSNNYLVNALEVMSWKTKSSFSKLKDPVDKEQWFAGPQLVNAFYLPNRNEINILAGILQPPFYYGRKAPRATNFGGIGMVLAHELSHGFDARGRYFNKDGEIIDDWWSNYTSQGFEQRAQCMVDQYNKYPVDGGVQGQIYIDGKLTLSENIADNGGIRLAYRGYKNWVKKNGEEALLPGLNKTNEQLLFISFAQMWCSAFTPEAAYYLNNVDNHALANYRVIGPLSNMEEFAEVFKCPANSRMNPEKKCKVW